MQRPLEIHVTSRSPAMQGLVDAIHDAIPRGKGIVLIAPPEDALEVSSLVEHIMLDRNLNTPIAVEPPAYDMTALSDRGLVIPRADQVPLDVQERFVPWMNQRNIVRQPVIACFTSEGRWSYCRGVSTRPPSSQRDRVVQWSDKFIAAFKKPMKVTVPPLALRQHDLLGIVLATAEQLRLTQAQTDLLIEDERIDKLVAKPRDKDTVLKFVNAVCSIAKDVLNAIVLSGRRPSDSAGRRPLASQSV